VILLVVMGVWGATEGDLALSVPPRETWALLATIGVIGTCAHLLMTWSLRFAPSATLAPMQYLEIPFATIIGWFLFRDFPNGLAAAGIAVTVATGLYIVYREQLTARASRILPAETADP
jgi:drug/metabolite transporter (DMT)-like permease